MEEKSQLLLDTNLLGVSWKSLVTLPGLLWEGLLTPGPAPDLVFSHLLCSHQMPVAPLSLPGPRKVCLGLCSQPLTLVSPVAGACSVSVQRTSDQEGEPLLGP